MPLMEAPVRCVAAAFVLSSVISQFATDTSWAISEDNKRRMKNLSQCTALLSTHDKGIRNRWRGTCGIDALQEEVGSAPLEDEKPPLLDLESESAASASGSCSATLSWSPIAASANCGLNTGGLAEHLNNEAVVRIPLPGNKCGYFIPILLTNKIESFACNAVFSRIACVDVSRDERSATTTVTLSTQRKPKGDGVTVAINSQNVELFLNNTSSLVTHPQFVLLPAKINEKDVISRTLADLKEWEKSCGTKADAASCKRLLRVKADAFMQEWMRTYLNPGRQSTKAGRLREAEMLIEFLKSNGVSSEQKQEAWLYFLVIAKNEVGLDLTDERLKIGRDPIYGLSDAVKDSSGLSFGAHQIDLGANSESDVQIFWNVLASYSQNFADKSIEQAKENRKCVELPLRLMPIQSLGALYRVAPKLTTALGSDGGRAAYNRYILTYLKETTASAHKLGGLFKQSMLARFLFIDKENHFGKKRATEDVLELVRDMRFPGLDFANCKDIKTAEDKIVEKLMAKSYPERPRNIRKLVREKADRGGVSHCR